MKKLSKLTAVLLACAVLITGLNYNAKADQEVHKNVRVSCEGEDVSVMGLVLNYDHNLYVSLRGIAYILRNTSKAFSFEINDSAINVTTGVPFTEPPYLWTEEELIDISKISLARNEINVDGIERKYYSLIGNVGEGSKDAFMNVVSVAMMLNADFDVDSNGIVIHPDEPFHVSKAEIENSGYTQGTNALLVGDGTTGDVFFSYNEESPELIASTTKLMTYFVMMDAVARGDISLDDSVMISKCAEDLSNGIDGVIKVSAGSSIPLNELIYGMILKSSNECALAIAEHVAGTEAAFVEKMNDKASELSLIEAEFYNCNGLPIYEDQFIPAKMQNHMSAKDMFILASNLVNTYPEVLEITSIKTLSLPSLGTEVKNTNAILYNIDAVKGLKTGTTNKSGACLITCAPVEKDGKTHNIISVLFGAESEVERATISEVMVRFGMDELKTYEGTGEVEEEPAGIPSDPEQVMKKLIKTAFTK